MSLSLACRCGTRFEVEETYAGQEVTCPQCQSPVKAPAAAPGSIRTCDFAIVSLVLALVGAFTVVGTLAAILLGIVSIIRIQRNRQRLAGLGYAVSGIVFGILFTGLTVLAITTGEVFGIGERVRQRQLAGKVEDDEDLAVVKNGVSGFRITRPSHDWVVAKKQLKDELEWEDSALVLVHRRRDVTVEIYVVGYLRKGAEEYADDLLERYQVEGHKNAESHFEKVSDVKLRQKTILTKKDGAQRVEMVLDMRLLGQPFRSMVRVVKSKEGQIFLISGRAHARVFKQVEDELRQLMDSFEPLDQE